MVLKLNSSGVFLQDAKYLGISKLLDDTLMLVKHRVFEFLVSYRHGLHILSLCCHSIFITVSPIFHRKVVLQIDWEAHL